MADTPPIDTVVVPKRLVPVIVTLWLPVTGPSDGEIAVTVGAVSYAYN